MRILLIAPYYDRNVPGESWSTYKWVEGISRSHETTILTQHSSGWRTEDSPVQAAQIVNWDEPKLPGFKGRIAWELKPGYLWFYLRARRWLKKNLSQGRAFDVIHQINPLALRYPSPAQGLGQKYIIGPLAGSLPTPEAFQEVAREKLWFRRLRSLDPWRIRHDPLLHRTYRDASAVIGVAPYVAELLSTCQVKRFEIMAETGIENWAPQTKPLRSLNQPLRLLFVGRLIHTKGIIEAIESVAIAAKSSRVTLDIAGTGDLEHECRQLISKLGIHEIVKLHGRISREEVFRLYDRSDVFLFPSYREPSGNVVFEAMSRGLPVVTTSVGGPAYVVTDSCGMRVAPASREGFVKNLVESIAQLSRNPQLVAAMSEAALERIAQIAHWPKKIEHLSSVYESILREQ